MGWGGRWEGGSGWGTHVNPWLIHVSVWQKPLQYCKVISLQLIKINEKNILFENLFITENFKYTEWQRIVWWTPCTYPSSRFNNFQLLVKPVLSLPLPYPLVYFKTTPRCHIISFVSLLKSECVYFKNITIIQLSYLKRPSLRYFPNLLKLPVGFYEWR